MQTFPQDMTFIYAKQTIFLKLLPAALETFDEQIN